MNEQLMKIMNNLVTVFVKKSPPELKGLKIAYINSGPISVKAVLY